MMKSMKEWILLTAARKNLLKSRHHIKEEKVGWALKQKENVLSVLVNTLTIRNVLQLERNVENVTS